MNSVILIGRLTKEVELRYLAQSEKPVATFSIAVDRPFSKEKTADFFRIVVFGKVAENCANYLVKGKLVGVQGRLQNNNYETQSGEKKYTTEVIADKIEFLEWGDKTEKQDKPNDIPEGFAALEDDDDIDSIPF